MAKFKVGNRVTILHEDYEGQEGIVGRVMENKGNPHYIVNIRYPEKVIMVCFGENDLELSSNQDKSAAGPYIDYTEPKFKQGDLVVVRPPFHTARYWNRFGTVTNVIATATLKNMRNTYLIQFDNKSLDADAEAFDECCLQLVPRLPKYKVGDQVDICCGCVYRTITSIEYWSNEDIFEYHLEHTIAGETYKEMLPENKLCPIEDKVVIPKFKNGDIVEFHPDDPGAPADYTIWGKVIIVETPFLHTNPFTYIILPLVGISVKRYYKIKEDDLKLAEMAEPSKDFRLFVSQPMSGLDMDEILKARQSAIDTFINIYEQSCNIDLDLNLVVIDNIQEEFTKQCEAEGRTPHSLEYLGNDIKMMKDADAIVFAKGWENSKGCSVEFLVAKHNNIPMYFE